MATGCPLVTMWLPSSGHQVAAKWYRNQVLVKVVPGCELFLQKVDEVHT